MKSRRKKYVGLLGGSFNPAHEGHLHISLAAFRRLGIDEVWWMVSPQNPLKSTNDMWDLSSRLKSAKSLARHPKIRVLDIETELGTTYTADTLVKMQKRFADHKFIWLMGADNLKQFPKWKNWQQIFDTTPIAVFGRSGYDLGALSGKAARRFKGARYLENRSRSLKYQAAPAWTFLAIRRHPESATRIRHALRKTAIESGSKNEV
ncbi:MAG: nicotinate-nucleotide adenylyltransferase [Alphaproteobacteria bacterium]|nr:nicotinate-nucleotide adenylyltransferase [Alphaproteobacteria bacterium]